MTRPVLIPPMISLSFTIIPSTPKPLMLRDVHSGGIARQVGGFEQFGRQQRPAGETGIACPARDESSTRGTSPRYKTHNADAREVHYPWHPWFGRKIWVYRIAAEQMRSARCGLEPSQCAKSLEIPLWMLEPVPSLALSLSEIPRVDCMALQGLRTLLRDRVLEHRHPLGGADAETYESTSPRATGLVRFPGGSDRLAQTARRSPEQNDGLADEATARTLGNAAPSLSGEEE